MAIETHPAAALFPLLTGKEYESFKADIEKNGLLEAIWLCDEKILDGRNRYRACQELGIEPRFREYMGDSPVAFVWSLNGERRHSTKSQLATVSVNMIPMLAVEAKKRQVAHLKQGAKSPVTALVPERETGEVAAQAAAITGAGTKYVYLAKRVKKEDPELFKQVEAGAISVKKAIKILVGKNKPPDPNAKKQPRAKRAADIRRLARAGHRAAQIAAELGISIPQIRIIARACEIELPDAKMGKSRSLNIRRIIENTVSGLEGYAIGLKNINGTGFEGLTASEAAEWASSITKSLKPIHQLHRQLSEIANGQA